MRMTVWIKKEWYVWPVAWILAGRNYVSGIRELAALMLDGSIVEGRELDRLHVLSHGNVRRDPASGEILDRFIDLGGGDRISLGHFGPDGNPIRFTPTGRFLDVSALVMRPGGRLIFSACHQGDGELLRAISRHIGKGVKVSGYRGLGHPFGAGDLAFIDGEPAVP